MHRNQYMANRIREVYLDGKWVANTNYKCAIEKLTWIEATSKLGNLNTIGALIFHVNYYLAGLIEVFEGGEFVIRDKYSFDMPLIESQNIWNDLRNTFLANAEKFAAHVENLQDTQFDEPFVDEKYGTYLRNIEGVIEHGYYHLGQISLIIKMIKEK
ncbi:MAG TPA: DinB family protein [Saprospiraceae bacterium]|nr:DinB family protein [Saprospiraceae bacterium]